MSIIGLLILLLVFCLALWCVRALMSAFCIGDPIATVVYVVFVLIFVLFVIQQLGFIGGGPVLKLN
jgi:hypothetical protein